jgi:hypothetical protein
VLRETSFGDPGINGRMHFPRAYRSLPRPSSLTKPSHSPTGVFALYQVHHFFFFTIAAPETIREHFRKATQFSLCQLHTDIVARFPVILYTTVIADRSATSFIPHENGELHIQYFGHTNLQDNPLHEVARTVKLRR